MTRGLHSKLVQPFAVLALSGALFAQGADDCASAQPINTYGIFAFDNTAASTDGGADCGGAPVRRDVWFAWTAPTTDAVVVDLCGMTSLVTRVAVYDGLACPATNLLACNSIVCTFQSQAWFGAIAGQQYLIRVGSKQVGQSGSGNFEIRVNPCDAALDDGFEENDTCETAVPLGDGVYSGLYVSKIDADYYQFDLAEGATLQLDILFAHAGGDIDTYLFDECGAQVADSASGDSDELIIYMNTGSCNQRLQLRVEHWIPDTISECNNYDLIVSGEGAGTSCSFGTNYCTSTANSTGSAAAMSASGSVSVASNNLVLASGPVPNQPGLFFYSAGQTNGGAGIPFGNGLRCAGNGSNPLYRLPVSGTGGNNELSWAVDNTMPPAAAATLIAGSTFHFQCWFRDPLGGGASYDLSDGLSLSFLP
ncbi:MAG: hypothetical protein ACI841_000483 [Planctomycetota bacterium]|jgi:hypothetical protein